MNDETYHLFINSQLEFKRSFLFTKKNILPQNSLSYSILFGFQSYVDLSANFPQVFSGFETSFSSFGLQHEISILNV